MEAEAEAIDLSLNSTLRPNLDIKSFEDESPKLIVPIEIYLCGFWSKTRLRLARHPTSCTMEKLHLFLRVTIGTWNVAGRLPDEDLDIDEWLCMNEPADIYILGFQEVVTLSAGNVLGAENRRPIPKWETIIHQTLNRTTVEPEAKLKSYSAPP